MKGGSETCVVCGGPCAAVAMRAGETFAGGLLDDPHFRRDLDAFVAEVMESAIPLIETHMPGHASAPSDVGQLLALIAGWMIGADDLQLSYDERMLRLTTRMAVCATAAGRVVTEQLKRERRKLM